MKVVIAVLLSLFFSSTGFSQGTVKVKEASITGERVTLGQGADIVQSRLKADKFVSSGYNPGDTSKGYYNDKDASYVVTFGPPKSGVGGYVVTQIEKVSKQQPAQATPSIPSAGATSPTQKPTTREQVIEARRKFKVQVISFDGTQQFGTEFPYSDYARIKVTNGSKFTLNSLTVLTKRFDNKGKMVGSSRAPSVPVGSLLPGQSAEADYYPRGHLPGVKKITVEIESLIPPDVEHFFGEFSK